MANSSSASIVVTRTLSCKKKKKASMDVITIR
ncbi:CLUMA_CG004287, isoform A [Clunio marinus]|uniref:CLUMA_CG004287, isoform A n=1 Tax=Clunio marinus TaxID=568069 RepID=A0A1J1HWT2_9DIPT|nr:CLUMA_CG004287, isoform A [Clunio marinus]